MCNKIFNNIMDGNILLTMLKEMPPFGELPFDYPIWSKLLSEDVHPHPEESKVLILCGPSGCGKSTIKKQLLPQLGMIDYINIDPDEIRTFLMTNGVTFFKKQKKATNESIPDDKLMGQVTNAYNKRICDEAQRQRLNIIFDTTGQNYTAIKDLINASKEIPDYHTYFTIIWASKDTCLRRVDSRNALSGERKELPLEIAANIYDGFMREKGTASMFLLDYPVHPDEVFLYNNDVDSLEEAELLYHKIGKDVVKSTDFPDFYNMSLHVESPYITKSSEAKGRIKKRKSKKRKSKKRKSKKKKSKKRKSKNESLSKTYMW